MLIPRAARFPYGRAKSVNPRVQRAKEPEPCNRRQERMKQRGKEKPSIKRKEEEEPIDYLKLCIRRLQEEQGEDNIIWEDPEDIAKYLEKARELATEAMGTLKHAHQTKGKKGPSAILREAGVIKTFSPRNTGNPLRDKMEMICKEVEYRADN